MTKPYPLGPLHQVRQAAVEKAKRDVADAAQATRDAAQETKDREAQWAAAKRELDEAEAADRAASARADLRVSDLRERDAWRRALQRQVAQHAEQVEHARQREQIARDHEAKLQRHLASVLADREIVSRHKESWSAEQAKQEEQRAGDELDELAAVAHHLRNR